MTFSEQSIMKCGIAYYLSVHTNLMPRQLTDSDFAVPSLPVCCFQIRGHRAIVDNSHFIQAPNDRAEDRKIDLINIADETVEIP